MMCGIKVVLKYLLGTDKANRNFRVYRDDTFVVSYPRSGNTWTRFLIANLVYPHENVSFLNIERLIPDTSSQSSRKLKRTPRPRIIKTHYDFQRKYRQIEDKTPLIPYVDDFICGRLVSADWGTWRENVASWVYTRGQEKDFLLVRYEDLQDDAVSELGRIAHFLGADASDSNLRQAVELSSADRMRKLEKQEQDNWIATKNRRKDIPFVGKAKSGSWKTNLPAECVQQMESAWGDVMHHLGYRCVTQEALQTT